MTKKGFEMNTTPDVDNDEVTIRIHESPVKLTGEITMSPRDLLAQAEAAKACLRTVDYHQDYGTCGDERERIGTRSGETVIEPHPSVFGGPDIYAMYMNTLTGAFTDDSSSPDEQLSTSIRGLRDGGIPSGGHEHCAASGKFGKILSNIANNRDAVHAYARQNMEFYDHEVMDQVISYAEQASASGIYDGWDGEKALIEALGKHSGQAIERLADVPHEAKTLIRNKRAGLTVDQTSLHEMTDGDDSFVHDDAYAEVIELALSSGFAESKRMMEHAREALMVGVALAVPNKEIHQIDLI